MKAIAQPRRLFKSTTRFRRVRRVITLKGALEDFLNDAGLSLSDVLSVMDDDPRGIIESLLKRVDISEEEAERLEKMLTSDQLNLLILVLHVFYYANPSGYYKGFLIYPPYDQVVGPNGKITREGLNLVMRSLGIVPGASA